MNNVVLVPTEIIKEADLKPIDVKIYIALLEFFQNNRFGSIGVQDLAKLTNSTMPTVKKALRRLVEHKFIKTYRRGVYLYKIAWIELNKAKYDN